MDDSGSNVLSAGLYEFLGSARALGIKSVAVSLGQRRHARGVRASALAGAGSLANQRSVAGRGDLGVASSASRIGRVGDRTEKHAVVFVLSVVDLVLFEVARAQISRARSTFFVELYFGVALRYCGDFEQDIDGHATGCPRTLLVVERRSLALAQHFSSRSICVGFGTSLCVDNLGTKVS